MNGSLVRALRNGMIVAVLAACVSLLAVGPAAASTTINDYVVYSENGLQVGQDSTVNGMIGARNNGTQQVSGGNAIQTQGTADVNGDVRSGGDVNNQGDINGALYRKTGTTLTPASNQPAGGDNVVDDPMLPTFPAATVFNCGGTSYSGGDNQSLTLTPGSYGDINYDTNLELTLDGAGNYYINSFHAGDNLKLILTHPGVNLYVCGSLFIGNGIDQTGASKPSDLNIEVHGNDGHNALRIEGVGQTNGVNNKLFANLFAPNGGIHIGSGSSHGDLYGRIVGFAVDLEHGLLVQNFATKSGMKFNDVNGNGQHDAGEPGMGGWTIYVDYNNNGQLDAGEPFDVTAADGSYTIQSVMPNTQQNPTWHVREVQQTGWTCTYPATKDGFGCYYEETFAISQSITGNDFGNHKPDTPCVPGPGQDANCQPIVVNCVPTAGQDANCQPIVTPKCVPTAGQDKNCKPIVETAKITGVKGGCSTVQKIRVSGSNIKKVTYKIDGKTVKTVKKKPYSYTLKTKNYKVGAHKLKVTTMFASGKTQTKTYTFQHCKAVAPRFTG